MRDAFSISALISLPLSQSISPGGKVYAFEPGDVNRQLLKRHLVLNRITNVDVFDALVGQSDQTMVPFYQADGDNPMNTVAPNSESSDFVLTKKPQVSIDGMCQRFGLSPDIIKIDVEGAELEVIRGAQATLKRCQPTLFLSVHPRQIKDLGHSLTELVGLVRESGYEFFDLNGRMCDNIGGSEYLVKPKTTLPSVAAN